MSKQDEASHLRYQTMMDVGAAMGGIAFLCLLVLVLGCNGGIAIPPELVDALTNRPPVTTTTQPPIATEPVLQPDHIATVAIGCKCDLTKPAISAMPDVQQATFVNSHKSECGLEENEGKPIRPIVTERRNILTVSDIYYGKIVPVDGGYRIPCDVAWLGYRWHPIGYSIGDDHVDKMQVRFKAGEAHIVPHRFRVFLFVEGRK